MKIIVALDDQNGMLFNHRRQSQDRNLSKYIALLAVDGVLRMNKYSYGLFSKYSENIVVSEDFLSIAASDDYCFVEDVDLTSYEEKITEFYLCQWNRIYPADLYFSIDMSRWELADVTDLQGHSHNTITVNHYVRKLPHIHIKKQEG